MQKLKALILLLSLILAAFILTSCNEPENPGDEPPQEGDVPPTEEEKKDAVDKIVEIFASSGENVIGNMLSRAPGASEALSGYEGELVFDSQTVYLKDGCIVVGENNPNELHDAYMLSGTTLAWVDGTPSLSDWRLIGTTELVDTDTVSPIATVLGYVFELDFNDIEKSDVAYEDGLYVISESFIKSSLSENLREEETANLSDTLELFDLRLGFSVKKSKIIGVELTLDAGEGFFDAIEDEKISKFGLDFSYSLNSVGTYPESLSFDISAKLRDGAEISANAEIFMFFDDDGSIEALTVNADVSASNLALYTKNYNSQGFNLEVRSNPSLSLNVGFNGKKFLLPNSDVLDFKFSYDVGDELEFLLYGFDGEQIPTENNLGANEIEAIKKRTELKNAYYEIDVKTESEIKKGKVTVTYRDGVNGGLTRESFGAMIYGSSPNFPLPDEIVQIMKDALAD